MLDYKKKKLYASDATQRELKKKTRRVQSRRAVRREKYFAFYCLIQRPVT